MDKKTKESYIQKIIEESGLSEEHILKEIENKIKDLKGLISDEGAILIIGRELGVEFKIKTKEVKSTVKEKEAINELVEEIQEENKEIIEIMKSKEYKILFNALYRALIKAIDYAIGKNIFSFSPDSSEKTTTKKETKTTLEYIDIKDYEELDKSYKIENDKGKIAFIGKSLVDNIDGKRIHLTPKAQKWFTEDKITWENPKEK